MTPHRLGSLAALCLSAALIAPAMAQEFGAWDANGDGVIGEEEWDAGFGGTSVFSDWDANGDGGIDEAEFATGVGAGGFDAAAFGGFSAWDANRDKRLDRAEFSRGVFGVYDRDGVAGLSEAEFGEADRLLE